MRLTVNVLKGEGSSHHESAPRVAILGLERPEKGDSVPACVGEKTVVVGRPPIRRVVELWLLTTLPWAASANASTAV